MPKKVNTGRKKPPKIKLNPKGLLKNVVKRKKKVKGMLDKLD